MIKSSELWIVVESVEDAVKFYTEKLAFDIIDLQTNEESHNILEMARLRKGKCIITFRTPSVEELAEFSFIKRCVSRCMGLCIEFKKGIERYFERCQKKGIKIVSELQDSPTGKSFGIKDPFGMKLIFIQNPTIKPKPRPDLAGMKIDFSANRDEADLLNEMIDHLKAFGILRRASKKYAKFKLKQLKK